MCLTSWPETTEWFFKPIINKTGIFVDKHSYIQIGLAVLPALLLFTEHASVINNSTIFSFENHNQFAKILLVN